MEISPIRATFVPARVVLASEDQLDAVRTLWREYWAAFGLADDFQNFAEELKTLPGVYAPPSGVCFWR